MVLSMSPTRKPNPPNRHRQLRVISLFTGVGGLDFGFEAAGFETAVALEIDDAACGTIRLNRPWPVIASAVENVTTKEILKVAGLEVGNADVLIGGPPCQPFSKSGYWKSGDAKRLQDPRANTLDEFLRVLREAKPRSFLLENVPGLAFDEKSEGLAFLLKGIKEVNRRARTNYAPVWKVLNAAAYGVPQIRERLFLVGSRDGKPFSFPAERFQTAESPSRTLPAFRTTWDALGDLESLPVEDGLEVGGKWAELLPSIPEGANYLWHTSRGGGQPLFGWRTRYWSFLLKLAKNRPSWTIQAQPGPAIGPFHWKSRRLSAQELCRIQTFPDGLVFNCGRSDVQRMVGNAVPSLLSEVIAQEIRVQLLGGRRTVSPPNLLPPNRGAPPPPERVKAVSKIYLPLRGEHADHPGTGRGKGAKARIAQKGDLFTLESKARAA
jgi:DNA (cytosine-5)-methyltransferase 1